MDGHTESKAAESSRQRVIATNSSEPHPFAVGQIRDDPVIQKDVFRFRGWYICDQRGVYYLHKNGKVLRGTRSDESGFWPSEAEAREFHAGWAKTVETVCGVCGQDEGEVNRLREENERLKRIVKLDTSSRG